MLKKIEALSTEQKSLLLQFRQQWLDIGLSTHPAVREPSEKIIADFYAKAGHTKPVFWWVDSPLQANLIIAVLQTNLGDNLNDTLRDTLRDNLRATINDTLWSNLGDTLRDTLRGTLNDNLGDTLRDNLGATLSDTLRDTISDNLNGTLDTLGDNLYGNLRDKILDILWSTLNDTLRDTLRDNLGGTLRDNLRDTLHATINDNLRGTLRATLRTTFENRCFWGSLDAYWIAFYLFPHEHLRNIYTEEQTQIMRGWETLAKNCFWWYPFTNICFVSDRPSVIEKDNETRLHNDHGPAFAFRDGWKGYYWHGVRVPEMLIERPHELTVQHIKQEQNMEVRRVMTERYGVARYLQDSGAKPIHADKYGTLYRKGMLNDEPIVMVKVLNSTPEPDGHCKAYFRRIPPNIKTAHAAVAWTFGMTPEEYHPDIES